MSAQDEAKLAAARRAVEMVQPGMIVGLGSGSTATLFIRELGARVAQGLDVRGIASSEDSEVLARELGIPITDFTHHPQIDVAVDGADEIAPMLDGSGVALGMAIIKGGGGKLLREKIVASAAKRFIIVADDSKLVRTLGKFPLPVEVIPMAEPLVAAQLRELGFVPKVRAAKVGAGAYITDEGNLLLDCVAADGSASIVDPVATAAAIRDMVGVVEHGLFLCMAERALVAGPNGVRDLLPGDIAAAVAP